jgi:cobalt-zinc-cadmium efflux system outer membrane protein
VGRSLLPAVLALLVPLPARAEGLTLGVARARAERFGPPVEVAERQHEVARTEIAVAGTLANPTVTLQTSKETARIIAGASLPLPLFGQRGKAVAAAQADAEGVALERELGRITARWNATNAWVDLWAAQERGELLALASEESARLLQISRERVLAGSAPRLDAVRATADRARARAEADSARAAVDAAAARLVPWTAGDPGELPRAVGRPQPPDKLPALAEVTRRAQEHPLLRRDRAQVRAAGAHVALEQRLRIPVPSAEVSVDYQDRTNDNRTDVIGGLAFELPLLGLRGGAIARARAQKAGAETSFTLDERQLRSELNDAYYTTGAAAARSRALREEVLPALDEARKMSEEGYRAGRLDILRLIEAQHAVIEARLAVLDATVTWCHALADLERSTGVELYAR